MADDIEIKVESHVDEVKKELDKATDKILYAWGLLGVQGAVEKASEKDNTTGSPTVDTGRYRAGFGFITPDTAKMNSYKSNATQPRDNITNNRADQDTVIIANNVEYASFLETGTSKMHARNILRRGIDSKKFDMERQAKKILKNTDISTT